MMMTIKLITSKQHGKNFKYYLPARIARPGAGSIPVSPAAPLASGSCAAASESLNRLYFSEKKIFNRLLITASEF